MGFLLLSKGCIQGPHDLASVSGLASQYRCLVSHTCLPFGILWALWIYTCLPLVSHSGCLGPHEFTLVSQTCLPQLSVTLVFHSGCLGLHEFTLVSHICVPLWVLRSRTANKDAEIILVAAKWYNRYFLHLFGVNAGIIFFWWKLNIHREEVKTYFDVTTQVWVIPTMKKNRGVSTAVCWGTQSRVIGRSASYPQKIQN